MPNYLAVKVTSFFLKKNIHVFCEKPPSRNYKELKSLKPEKESKKIIWGPRWTFDDHDHCEGCISNSGIDHSWKRTGNAFEPLI